ncbi:MAG: T9SS type A sorting domain-containing protein [Ignavibacteria bacterium]|nr:T9SS type A sorting domain-containing protein [Ignavibacteria bacterium]
MKKFIKLTIIIFAISLFHNFTYSQWVSVTSGTSNFLTSVQIITNNLTYACGFTGTVLKSTNIGQTWTPLTSPSSGNINKIFFPATGNATTGWAASVSGLYKSTNSGQNWVQQVASTVFADLLFPDLNTGLALTSNNTLRRTTNGGTNFTSINFTSDASIHGIAISIGSSSTYFILGLDNVVDTSFIFKSTNAGVNWTQTAKLPLDYFAMTFVNASTGIICGDAGIMKRTTNGGTNWSTINTGTTNDLQNIKFITSTKVYAVGSAGTILKSTNAGATWVAQVSNSTAALRGLDVMSTDDNGIVCGASGTVRRTTNGGSIPTGIQIIGGEIPGSFSLGQNYPNPFNPATNITFSIPNAGYVSVKVYDIMGKEIADVVDQNLTPGIYTADFDASALPSGTYFYRLTAGSFTETKKMILIK